MEQEGGRAGRVQGGEGAGEHQGLRPQVPPSAPSVWPRREEGEGVGVTVTHDSLGSTQMSSSVM